MSTSTVSITNRMVVYYGVDRRRSTREIAIAAIDAGADVIELGVPFSDPLADGPIIQRASERALARGTRLKDVLALAREFAPRGRAPAWSSSAISIQFCATACTVCRRCRSSRRGWRAGHRHDCRRGRRVSGRDGARGISRPSFSPRPPVPMSACRPLPRTAKGFVYAISRVGITGKQQSVAADAASLVARIRRWSKLPVAVGFGISNADHVAQVAEFADAAVIGSAIVELVERSTPDQAPGAVARFIKGLRLNQAALAR